MITETIVLTAPPAVVDLRKRFRELDAKEQALKLQLEDVREEKAQIAVKVFNLANPAATRPT